MSKIFLSWSKERSFLFARALRDLMVQVLRDQGAPVAASDQRPGAHLVTLSEDLPKGGNWFSNLADSLENARAGIVCVTPENRGSPWLLFEAGALIRCDVEVRLFPVLFDVLPPMLEGPLSLLQATVVEPHPERIRKEIGDLLRLVVDHVNSSPGMVPLIEQPISPAEAPKAWSQFVADVIKIEPATVKSVFTGFSQLFERKSFREPFHDCADQRWLDRYAAARRARTEMESRKESLRAVLTRGTQMAYDGLSSKVDSFAMAIGGMLLEERRFERDTHGRLEDSSGALNACEERRKDIETAYLRLIDPAPPVYDEARIYEELDGLEERKRLLIHPLERQLQDGSPADKDDGLAIWRLERAKTSGWLYDRIVYYLHGAYGTTTPTIAELMTSLEFEVSRLEALDEPDTLVGLYYALDALRKRSGREPASPLTPGVLDRIEAAIERWNRVPSEREEGPPDRWDANFKVRRLVARLRGPGQT